MALASNNGIPNAAAVAAVLLLGAGAPAWAQSVDRAALAAKLAPVVVCINRVDMKMAANTKTYRDIVAKLSANPKADTPYFTFKIEPFEANNQFSTDCAAGLDASAAAAPKIDDLDATARDYAATLRALVPLMNEAEPYYAQHDYKDDAFARGKAMDAKLSPQLAKFEALSRDLRAESDREELKLRRAELDELASTEGKKLHYWTVDLMFEARVALERIMGNVKARNLSADGVAEAIVPLQAAFEGGTKQAAGDPGDAAAYPAWARLQPAMNHYLEMVKSVRRDMADKSPGAKVGADLRDTVSAFNDLVTSYNIFSAQR